MLIAAVLCLAAALADYFRRAFDKFHIEARPLLSLVVFAAALEFFHSAKSLLSCFFCTIHTGRLDAKPMHQRVRRWNLVRFEANSFKPICGEG